MNLSEYWKEKETELEKNKCLLGKTDKKKQEIIRKMIIVQIMQIPIDDLEYYLKRDQWLRDFSGDCTGIDNELIYDNEIKEKTDEIIETVFYKPDLAMIRRILKKSQNSADEKNYKQKICALIKDAVYPENFDKLHGEDRETVLTLEKVYTEPVELINGYIREKIGPNTYHYYSLLMEQWKTANEMAANISAQRNNMNNFYMSLMSILVGGVLLGDGVLKTNIDKGSQTVLYIFVIFIGTLCCNKWIRQINSYKELNATKFEIINELERFLPANVMLCEWIRVDKKSRRKKRVVFSDQDISIAKTFRVVMIIVPAVILDKIWLVELLKLTGLAVFISVHL